MIIQNNLQNASKTPNTAGLLQNQFQNQNCRSETFSQKNRFVQNSIQNIQVITKPRKPSDFFQ